MSISEIHNHTFWMEKYARDVKSCPGYGVDKKVVVIESPTDTIDLWLLLGSFGVSKPKTCCTTRTLLSIVQSVTAIAGYAMPHFGYLDLANSHTETADDFALAGGSKLHTRPNPEDQIRVECLRESKGLDSF